MAIEKEIKIVVDADEANKSLKEVNENLDEGTEATEQMTGALDKMTGGAVSGFKGLAKGIKTGVKGLKSFKVALISTGIGILLIAIGSLIAYFTSSEEGANKLKVAFAAVGVVVDKLTESLAKVGKFLAKIGGIIKDVVTGDKTLREGWTETKEAAKVMAEEVTEAYTSIGSAVRSGMELQRRENQLRIDTRKNLVTEARLLVALSEAKLRNDDQTLTTLERLDSINEAEQLNIDIFNERIRQKNEEFEIQKQRNALSDSTEEDLLREAELQAELITLEAERNDRIKEFVDKRSSILKGEEDRRASELVARNAAIDAEIAADIKAFEAGQVLRDKEAQDKIDKAAAEKLLNQQVLSAKLGQTAQTIGLIKQMVDKDSKAYKGLAIAQATISGIQGTINAFTIANLSPITSVFPAYPYIQAGLAGAFAISNISKIASTDPTGKGSTGSPRTSTGSGGNRSPQFNVVSGTAGNQIAESLGNNNEPLKAYVIGSEVTTQQELDRKVVDNASL